MVQKIPSLYSCCGLCLSRELVVCNFSEQHCCPSNAENSLFPFSLLPFCLPRPSSLIQRISYFFLPFTLLYHFMIIRLIIHRLHLPGERRLRQQISFPLEMLQTNASPSKHFWNLFSTRFMCLTTGVDDQSFMIQLLIS